MILYGASVSPFVRKVLAFAAEAGIELEVKAVGLGSPDPGFLEASPFRKMPALRDGDFTVSDSTAIVAYLDALHPQSGLIPTEPKARARTIWYEEFADTIATAALAKVFFNRIVAPRFLGREGDMGAVETALRDEIPPVLAYLERTVPDSGFLVEDRLTLADLAVASPFVNFQHAGEQLDAAAYPRATAYLQAIHARPSFAAIIERERRMFSGG
jgi:glutathione S-transferase